MSHEDWSNEDPFQEGNTYEDNPDYSQPEFVDFCAGCGQLIFVDHPWTKVRSYIIIPNAGEGYAGDFNGGGGYAGPPYGEYRVLTYHNRCKPAST